MGKNQCLLFKIYLKGLKNQQGFLKLISTKSENQLCVKFYFFSTKLKKLHQILTFNNQRFGKFKPINWLICLNCAYIYCVWLTFFSRIQNIDIPNLGMFLLSSLRNFIASNINYKI